MFGKTFQGVGESMTQGSIKSAMQMGLGKLGGLFGIHIPGGGNPGSSPANPMYVVDVGKRGSGGGSAGDSGSNSDDSSMKIPGGSDGLASGVGGAMKSLSGMVGGFIGKIFGGSFAGGGDADPGMIYQVAEAGEGEFITPKNASTVTPLSKMGLGSTHNSYSYSIDARGAELGAENRIARAIEYAHNSAVTSSVRASAERAKRTPERTGK